MRSANWLLGIFFIFAANTEAAEQELQTIVSQARPGSTIHLRGHDYLYTQPLILSDRHLLGVSGTRLIGISNSVIILRSNSSLKGLHLIAPRTSTRTARDYDCNVLIPDATNVSIIDSEIEGAAACGMMVARSTSVTISGVTVHDTLADGIHLTDGSRDIRVTHNTVYRTGDDAIAVVSYQRNANPTSSVEIVGNDVSGNLWGRGITVVGGEDVAIANNELRCAPNIAGILIASEPYFKTRGVYNVAVRNNSLISCGNRRNSQGALTIYAGNAPITNVALTGNRIITPTFIPISVFGPYTDHGSYVIKDNRVDSK